MSRRSKPISGVHWRRSGLCRRSSRKRIAPVEYWNGASVKYDDDGTLIGVESVDAVTETRDGKGMKKSNKRYNEPVLSKPDKKHKRPSDIELRRKYRISDSCKRKRISDIEFNDISISSNNPDKKRKVTSDIEFSDSIISGPQHESFSFCKGQKIFSEHPDDITFCMGNGISDIVVRDTPGHRRETVFGAISMEMTCTHAHDINNY